MRKSTQRASPLQAGLWDRVLAPPRVQLISLAKILVDDAPPPSEALIASIRLRGLQTPVVLVESGAGRFTVKDGRRRVLALRTLGRDEVEARIWSKAHEELLSVAALELNEAREDNPVAAFRLLVRLRDSHDLDAKALARELRMPLARVTKLLGLESLGEDVIRAFTCGKISLAVAEDFAKLPQGARAELQEKLRKTGKLERNDIRGAKSSRAAQTKLAVPQELVDALFGQRVTIGAPTLADVADALSSETLELVVRDVRLRDDMTGPLATFEDALRRKNLAPAPAPQLALEMNTP